MAEFGIGRLAKDTDPMLEALAEMEAERLQPRPKVSAWTTCNHCGGRFPRNQAMSSAEGTVCPDCYDAAEGY